VIYDSGLVAVGACYGLGIGITFFKEMQHAYWYMMDEAKRGSMVGEALASLEQTQLHRGLGARAGGAFRSLVHQAQFVALVGEMGGRYGSATRGRFVFDVGNESVYPGLGTFGHPYYPYSLFNTTLAPSDPLVRTSTLKISRFTKSSVSRFTIRLITLPPYAESVERLAGRVGAAAAGVNPRPKTLRP